MVGVEEGREFRFRGDLYSQESREYFPSRFDLLWMCCRLQIVFTVVQQLTSFRVYRASCSPSAVVQLLVGIHKQADELPRLQYSHSTIHCRVYTYYRAATDDAQTRFLHFFNSTAGIMGCYPKDWVAR